MYVTSTILQDGKLSVTIIYKDTKYHAKIQRKEILSLIRGIIDENIEILTDREYLAQELCQEFQVKMLKNIYINS